MQFRVQFVCSLCAVCVQFVCKFVCEVISLLFVETRVIHMINSWKRIFFARAIQKSHFQGRFQTQKAENPSRTPSVVYPLGLHQVG